MVYQETAHHLERYISPQLLKLKFFSVYYGLSFGAGNLGGSVLMNNFLNGMVEFVCYIFLPFFIDLKMIGRKYGTVWTMGIGAIGKLSF